MRFFQTSAGNLCLQSEADDIEMLDELMRQHGHDEDAFLSGLLEETGWTPNGHLHRVRPEQVGALTNSPLLSDAITIGDGGDLLHVGKLWWYPNYMVSNLAERLVKDGSVTLTLAAEA